MAIYRPTGFSPSTGETRNMLITQVFSAIMSSKTTHYQLKIYNNSTGAQLYDSTKTTLVTVLYDGETLSATVPITAGIATVRTLKWTLQLWNGTETLDALQLKETYFKNYESPTISLSFPSTITSQSYTFTGVYTQAQNIDVERFKYTLYTSNGGFISESDWIYNESVKNTFNGFIDATAYKVKVEIYDKNDIYATSPVYDFSVNYSQPSVTFQPTITNLPAESAIQIGWTGGYALEGVLTGTNSYTSVGSETYTTINTSSNVVWTGVNIGSDFTYTHEWINPSVTYDGIIAKLEKVSTGKYYEVGYSGGRFYWDISGVIQYGSSYPLVNTNTYFISLLPETIKVSIKS